MNDYRILLSDSRGRSLTIAPDAACRLVEDGLAGFECAGFDVKFRSYAASPGGYAERRRFAERELSLTFAVEGDPEPVRRAVIAMMDPGEDLTLDAELYGLRRKIDVIPAEAPDFRRPTFSHPPEVTLYLSAPEVFFREAEPRRIQFRDGAPMFAFPLNLWRGAGTVSGILRVSDSAAVVNPGDGPCGVIVTLTAQDGDVTAPRVEANGQFIRCPLTLRDGDELTVDTRPRHKTISVNGERVFLFDRDSTFFSLPPGESRVTVSAESGTDYLRAALSFTPIYNGM